MAVTRQDPERIAASHEVGRGIQDCLSRMSRERRMAVTLYLQGHSVTEASSVLDWPAKRTETWSIEGWRICGNAWCRKGCAVTDRHAEDGRLKETFQALGETSQRELSPEEIDWVWRASPASFRRKNAGTSGPNGGRPGSRRGVAKRAGALARRGCRGGTRRTSPPESGVVGSWLAAAAVLIAGIGIAIVYQRSSLRDDTFRDPGHYVVESLVQPDVTLPRDAFRLRWTPGPPDTRYQVTVTTEEMWVLATIQGLAAPELTLDGRRSRMSRRAPGCCGR